MTSASRMRSSGRSRCTPPRARPRIASRTSTTGQSLAASTSPLLRPIRCEPLVPAPAVYAYALPARHRWHGTRRRGRVPSGQLLVADQLAAIAHTNRPWAGHSCRRSAAVDDGEAAESAAHSSAQRPDAFRRRARS
jgi:hypothetical protein